MFNLVKHRLTKALGDDFSNPRTNPAIESALAWLDGKGQLSGEEVALIFEVLAEDPNSDKMDAHRRIADPRVRKACDYVMDLLDPPVSETN